MCVCVCVYVCAYDNEINLCFKYIFFKVHIRLLPKNYILFLKKNLKFFSTDLDFSHYLPRILQYGWDYVLRIYWLDFNISIVFICILQHFSSDAFFS